MGQWKASSKYKTRTQNNMIQKMFHGVKGVCKEMAGYSVTS